MRVPALETPRLRLRLRPMVSTDAPAVQRHFGNWNVVKQIGADVPWPYPEDGAARYLADVLERGNGGDTWLWALVPKEGSDEPIGAIEYRLAPDEDDHRGFWLAEPFWGRGLMTEAVVATQDVVLLELGIERLVVRNAASNVGSRIVKRRCGARLVGLEPETYLSGDTSQEVWEVTRAAWLSVRDDAALERYRLREPARG